MKRIASFSFILLTLFLSGCEEEERALFDGVSGGAGQDVFLNDKAGGADFEGGGFCVVAPDNETECVDCGGYWGYIGLGPIEQCNLPTRDFGKICDDSSECESLCLAELTDDQWERARKGRSFEASGKCAGVFIVVGCHGLVENGRVNYITCLD